MVQRFRYVGKNFFFFLVKKEISFYSQFLFYYYYLIDHSMIPSYWMETTDRPIYNING